MIHPNCSLSHTCPQVSPADLACPACFSSSVALHQAVASEVCPALHIWDTFSCGCGVVSFGFELAHAYHETQPKLGPDPTVVDRVIGAVLQNETVRKFIAAIVAAKKGR